MGQAEAVETPQGIDLEKIKLKLVMKSAEEAEVKTDGSTMETIINDLQEHYRKNAKALAVCASCGGISDIELDACPFCGDEGEEETEAPAPPVKEAKSKAAAKESKKVKVVEVVEEEKPVAETKAITKASSTAILHVDDMTVAALDEARERIIKLKHRAQHSYWQLGKEIGYVFETGLWKMRVEGKVKAQVHKSFDAWCVNELEITSTTAYNMMDVAKAFTEEQVEKIGGTKLSIVLKAPEAEQPAILREVEAGAKVSEVQEKVKKAREKHGVTQRQVPGRKKMPVGGKKKPKVPVVKEVTEDGRLTVALVAGKVKLDMFAKPKTKPKDGETLKPAKKIEDGAIAVEELANGVTRYYALVRGPKGLRLEIETKRA